jgi:hypothetical protein
MRVRLGGDGLDDALMPGRAAYWSRALEREPGPAAGPEVGPAEFELVAGLDCFRLHDEAVFIRALSDVTLRNCRLTEAIAVCCVASSLPRAFLSEMDQVHVKQLR